jgi:hypothetical protein
VHNRELPQQTQADTACGEIPVAKPKSQAKCLRRKSPPSAKIPSSKNQVPRNQTGNQGENAQTKLLRVFVLEDCLEWGLAIGFPPKGGRLLGIWFLELGISAEGGIFDA